MKWLNNIRKRVWNNFWQNAGVFWQKQRVTRVQKTVTYRAWGGRRLVLRSASWTIGRGSAIVPSCTSSDNITKIPPPNPLFHRWMSRSCASRNHLWGFSPSSLRHKRDIDSWIYDSSPSLFEKFFLIPKCHWG